MSLSSSKALGSQYHTVFNYKTLIVLNIRSQALIRASTAMAASSDGQQQHWSCTHTHTNRRLRDCNLSLERCRSCYPGTLYTPGGPTSTIYQPLVSTQYQTKQFHDDAHNLGTVGPNSKVKS